MDISEIALYGAVGLLGVALLLIVIFGVRNIATGKHEWPKIVIVFSPLVLFGVLYAVTGQLSESALGTFVILLGLKILLIFFGGVRSSFKF